MDFILEARLGLSILGLPKREKEGRTDNPGTTTGAKIRKHSPMSSITIKNFEI